MRTIVSALKSEFSPLLATFSILEKRKIADGTLYRAEQIQFLRTGVGRDRAERVFDGFLRVSRPASVLNIGLAGALSPEYAPGQLFYIKEVLQEREAPTFALSKPLSEISFPAARLLTVGQAVTDASLRDKLHRRFSAGLVDMEAYYWAQRCAAAGIPFGSIKIISDRADALTEQTFLKNYKETSAALCNSIRPFLREK